MPSFRKFSKIIRDSDAVIVAPGGVCMGVYKSWPHIWNIELALRQNKKIAIWGRSIGPFFSKTKEERQFTEKSLSILDRVGFLGLRDKKSQELAEDLGYKYFPMIDSAFAYAPEGKLPPDLEYLEKENYVVFVPNQLYEWHPSFKEIKPSTMDNFYVEVLNFVISSGHKVIMLPQLFGNNNKADYPYFKKLKAMSSVKNNDIIVLGDTYDSDTQQMIVKRAKVLIGARYHSIIFSVNNAVPFLCLSYEHKMFDTMRLIGLTDYSFDLKKLVTVGDHKVLCDSYLSALQNEIAIRELIKNKNESILQIVLTAFNNLCQFLDEDSL